MSAWLPPGLWMAIRLRVRGAVRDGAARARTPSGAVAVLVAVLFFAAWLVPLVLLPDLRPVSPGWLARVGPFALLLVWFGQVAIRGGGEVLGFEAWEADQLFGAPFSPEQLLRYKVTLLLVAWTITAVLLSPMAMFYAARPVGGFLAMLLLLPMLQLSAMLSTLLRRGGRRRGVWRASFIGVLLLLGASAARMRAGSDDPTWTWLGALQDHPVASAILLPFRAGTGLLTETSASGLAASAAGVLAVDVALVALLLRSGRGAWLEIAAEGAARVQHTARQVRTGGGLGALGGVWRTRVPRLPRWGGVGTVAWRRGVEIARRPATFATFGGVVLLVLAIGALFPPAVGGMSTEATGRGMMLACMLWADTLVPGVLRLDFRADLDRMDPLLGLPIPAWALFVGQIVPMAALLTVLCWLVFAGVVAWAPATAGVGLALALAQPGFALAVLAIDNALFLWLPVRMEGGDAAISSVGRNLVVTVGGWALQGASAVAAAAVGALGWALTGQGAVGGICALVTLLCAAAAATAAGAWRLRRFDPTVDVPH